MAARVNRDEQHVLVNLDGWTNTPLIHEVRKVAGSVAARTNGPPAGTRQNAHGTPAARRTT